MFLHRATAPAGAAFAEKFANYRVAPSLFLRLLKKQRGPARSQVSTASAIPAPPALVLAIACIDAPASGSAQMPAAQVELSDIPAPSLLRTPAADPMGLDSASLHHMPSFEI